MIRLIFVLISFASLFVLHTQAQEQTSTRKERQLIIEGNKLYEQKDYKKACEAYDKAISENPNSYRAIYNRSLSQIRLGEDENIKESETRQKYMESGVNGMQSIANIAGIDPDLASKANFNLGNVAFKSEDYSNAVNLYKQSLRLNPNNENARKNLRIAQKKLQQQNKNQQDKNQQNNKDQEKKEEQKKEEQQQPQQNQSQPKEEPQQQQPKEGELSEQNADQILKSMENKEASTRQRMQGSYKERNSNKHQPKKRW